MIFSYVTIVLITPNHLQDHHAGCFPYVVDPEVVESDASVRME